MSQSVKLSKRQREVLIQCAHRGGCTVPIGARGRPHTVLQDLGLIRIGLRGGWGTGTYYGAEPTDEGRALVEAMDQKEGRST